MPNLIVGFFVACLGRCAWASLVPANSIWNSTFYGTKTSCYTTGGAPYAYAFEVSAEPNGISSMPVCTDTNSSSACRVNYVSGKYIVCLPDTYVTACNRLLGFSDWQTHKAGNNSVVLQAWGTTNTSSDYYCKKSSLILQYGCASGYYATSNASSSNSNIVCGKCPQSSTQATITVGGGNSYSGYVQGRSAIGNISISGCYLPKSDSTFSYSLTDTGVYRFTANCNYTM